MPVATIVFAMVARMRLGNFLVCYRVIVGGQTGDSEVAPNMPRSAIKWGIDVMWFVFLAPNGIRTLTPIERFLFILFTFYHEI